MKIWAKPIFKMSVCKNGPCTFIFSESEQRNNNCEMVESVRFELFRGLQYVAVDKSQITITLPLLKYVRECQVLPLRQSWMTQGTTVGPIH